MAHLSLRRVSKTYDSGVKALQPVDLEVTDGQLAVLVGPSGCGKSTLLRIIAGLEAPTSGQVLIDDAEVTNTQPKDRDVAMVFQNYALYPHMTVRENLGFALKMRGTPAEQRSREVDAVAELLELKDMLDRRPPQLSGGQQQRVALGRAIVRRPKLFLFDEPFSNLDATLRASTRTELLRLHRRLQATAVFVTHDQVEAMTMADVLVVMKGGRVLQIGAPLEVYRRPANLFVAQFIGFPPMNLLNPEALRLDLEEPPGAGKPILGLRAEHVTIIANESAALPSPNHVAVSAKVMLLELLGNEILVNCLVGGQDLVTRISTSITLSPGQDVRLSLDMSEAVWFDRDSGEVMEPEKVLT